MYIIYVCMYVWFVCMYVCIYVCMHVMYVMYVCMYVCMCMHLRIYACMYACMHAYEHVYVCARMHAHKQRCTTHEMSIHVRYISSLHIYVYTHTHTDTDIHTHTNSIIHNPVDKNTRGSHLTYAALCPMFLMAYQLMNAPRQKGRNDLRTSPRVKPRAKHDWNMQNHGYRCVCMVENMPTNSLCMVDDISMTCIISPMGRIGFNLVNTGPCEAREPTRCVCMTARSMIILQQVGLKNCF